MSSAFDLDFPHAPVQPIRPAATVIVVREAPSSYEIFMLKRTSKASFASGMYVFPGGRVDPDVIFRLRCASSRADRWTTTQVAALGDEWRGFWIACIRETFEEAGLMLAYTPDGELVSFADAAVQERFAAYRDPLHDGTLSLLDICRKENLKLAVDHIHFYNRFVTPLGRPRRSIRAFSLPRLQKVSAAATINKKR